MRTHSLLLSLLLVGLLTSGCEAPLKPKSQQSAGAATTPSAAPSSPGPAASALASPSSSAAASPKVPAIKVPQLKVPPRRSGPVLGADISWPQCPKGMGIPLKRSQGSPMPIAAARYVIIGLTNGPGYYPNPCLKGQTDWVRSRGLMAGAYSVISFPEQRHLAAYGSKGPYDGGTRLGALSNAGYQQARFNLQTMRAAGLQSPVIWLDVEPVPEYDWPADPTANAAVVKGAAKGYTDAGFRIGAYSTQALWAGVVGDLRLDLPEWRAAGQTSRAEALSRCNPEAAFNGGRGVISQWVEDERDQNVTCPGTAGELERWFHQY